MSKKKESVNDIELEVESSRRAESKYNPSILRQCILEGLHADVIMDRLGLKHKQVLRQHLLKLCDLDKTFYEINGLFFKSASRLRVNKKLEIKLHLKQIGLNGDPIQEGDEFDLSVDGHRITLTRRMP